MESRLNKPLVLLMVAVALLLGVIVGTTTGIADRLFGGPNPKTIASASLESMRAQNRLIAFVARYVSVVSSEQQRLGGLVSSERTLILPGDVRYELDLSKLEPRDVIWDASTKTVRIITVAGTLAAGKCVTTWWDWLTSHGHYDARAVRVCKSGQQSTKTWSGEDSRVTGLQKLGVCYGADNQTGSCKTGPGAVSASGRPNFCNWTTGSYTIKANGPPQSCSGGDPTSSTS